jgi:hypothetical protein
VHTHGPPRARANIFHSPDDASQSNDEHLHRYESHRPTHPLTATAAKEQAAPSSCFLAYSS